MPRLLDVTSRQVVCADVEIVVVIIPDLGEQLAFVQM
jgi:hypothetical protein